MLDIYRGLKRRFHEARFRRSAAAINQVASKPQFDQQANVTLLSMVQKKDVDMYLLAARSFIRYVNVSRIVIVADPSIDQADRTQLAAQLQAVEIVAAADFHDPDIPTGGTWERLTAISHYCQDSFVIQLDADTLTVKDPLLVRQCIAGQRGFTLGSFQGQQTAPLTQAADFASSKLVEGKKNHVQLLAESKLTGLAEHFSRYVRGCSGFCGFPQGSFSIETLRTISRYYRAQLGERWSDWGSEQFASNLVCANIPEVCVLPISEYADPKLLGDAPCFYHFIGPIRFTSEFYRRQAVAVLEELNQG